MTLAKVVIFFFIYSIIGYICEVTYCSIPKRRFMNRGFLYGPYLPIYGFGAVAVVLALEPFSKHWYLVFLCGILITSILEYFTSWLLEKCFHTKLWDYSRYKFNINGRVCLLNSVLFGLLCLVVIYVIQPFLAKLVDRLPLSVIDPLALVIAIGMTADATASIYHMATFQAKLKALRAKMQDIQERTAILQKHGSSPELMASAKERFSSEVEKLRNEIHHTSKRLVDAFPSMTSSNPEIKAQLDKLRESMKSIREKANLERITRRNARKANKK